MHLLICSAVALAAADNQLVFNNVCRTCHTLKEGDNRLGPNLHNIIGRKSGSVPDYSYSSAMKDADLTWDKATLDRFIANPDQVVPGNKMKPYGGLTSAEERAKIIAFLETDPSADFFPSISDFFSLAKHRRGNQTTSAQGENPCGPRKYQRYLA
jgi:cytochrome c